MTKLVILASSLVPVLAVLAVRLWDRRLLALVLVGAAMALTILLFVALSARHHTAAQPYTIADVADESDQIPAYLLTYISPFLFLEVENTRDVIASILFGLLVLVLLLRTNLALVNPLLLAVGFHLYRVHTDAGKDMLVVAREKLLRGETFQAVTLSATTYKLTS